MKKPNFLKIFIFTFLLLSLLIGQSRLTIVEYRPFPDDLSILNLIPTKVNWSIANKFLLLDQDNSELFEIGPFGDINLSSGIGMQNNRYGELIWMGVSPLGIQVVDRLENEIVHLDFRLNPIQTIPLNQHIYPEMAALDPWGRLFFYSKTYNGIFVYDRSHLNNIPFIDFYKEFSSNYCIIDMAVNQEGDLAIIGCDGIFHEFSQNGQIQRSTPSSIGQSQFLVSLRDDWLLFNIDGECYSINSQNHMSVPGSSIPIIDVISMNRSLAVLSKDHIMILNVQ